MNPPFIQTNLDPMSMSRCIEWNPPGFIVHWKTQIQISWGMILACLNISDMKLINCSRNFDTELTPPGQRRARKGQSSFRLASNLWNVTLARRDYQKDIAHKVVHKIIKSPHNKYKWKKSHKKVQHLRKTMSQVCKGLDI